MRPVLTIAVPTYNRAEKLDRQLGWLSHALRGLEDIGDRVELLVSDNCSSDDTPAVIRRWQERLGAIQVRVQRHPENIGAVRNIASCIRGASAGHVWVISDDDPIDDRAPAFVLDVLERNHDLALLVLNFSSRDVRTGRVLFERCFDVEGNTVHANGTAVFTHCMRPRKGARWGGLGLTTALVYRTDLARAALDAWPQGLDNLAVQVFWTGYCAVRGATLVTEQPLLECAAGNHHFRARPLTFLKLRSADLTQVLVRLAAEGVDPLLMLRKVLERPGAFVKMLPDAARQDPAEVARLLAQYTAALRQAVAIAATAFLRPRPRTQAAARSGRLEVASQPQR